MQNPASCHGCSCLFSTEVVKMATASRYHQRGLIHPLSISTAENTSQPRQRQQPVQVGDTPCALPCVDQVPKALKPNVERSGLFWDNLSCIWGLSSSHLSRPFSQGYSCTIEKDGDTMGCFSHFSPSCLSLWSDLQDTSGSQL